MMLCLSDCLSGRPHLGSHVLWFGPWVSDSAHLWPSHHSYSEELLLRIIAFPQTPSWAPRTLSLAFMVLVPPSSTPGQVAGPSHWPECATLNKSSMKKILHFPYNQKDGVDSIIVSWINHIMDERPSEWTKGGMEAGKANSSWSGKHELG